MYKIINVSKINDEMNFVTVQKELHQFNVQVRFIGNLHSTSNILIHQTMSYDISTLSSQNGWWFEIVGYGKTIDLSLHKIIIISKNDIIASLPNINMFEIAQIENEILSVFRINNLYINIGGSFGGAGALSFASISPKPIDNTIVISCTHKAYLHQKLYRKILIYTLENSTDPELAIRLIQKINILFYRDQNSWNDDVSDAELYLITLENKLPTLNYKVYLSILKILNDFCVTTQLISSISSKIHLIYSNSDKMHLPKHIKKFYEILVKSKKEVSIYKMCSNKGHDAFLLEQDKLKTILEQIIIRSNIYCRAV